MIEKANLHDIEKGEYVMVPHRFQGEEVPGRVVVAEFGRSFMMNDFYSPDAAVFFPSVEDSIFPSVAKGLVRDHGIVLINRGDDKYNYKISLVSVRDPRYAVYHEEFKPKHHHEEPSVNSVDDFVVGMDNITQALRGIPGYESIAECLPILERELLRQSKE